MANFDDKVMSVDDYLDRLCASARSKRGGSAVLVVVRGLIDLAKTDGDSAAVEAMYYVESRLDG